MKVFIVDDHPIVLEGLRNLLSQREEIDVTGAYATGREALEALRQELPDVILLDINLPDVNGTQLCREIKERHPSVRIIALSVHNERLVILNMLQQGANGYVLKNAIGKDIVDALWDVVMGKMYLCNGTREVLGSIDHTPIREIPRLTRREKEILALIGQGKTTQQIAGDLFISPHTVESHRKNLMEKFGVPNTAMVLKLATEHGLMN